MGVWVCFAPDSVSAQAEKYAALFRKVAVKWKKYRFLYVDTSSDKLPTHDPQCEQFPSIVFQKAEMIVRHAFEPAELTEANVIRFLKDASTRKVASSGAELN